MFPAPPREKECETDYAEELRDIIRSMHERARHALRVSQNRQKQWFDRKVHGPVYKQGDFVWLYRKSRRANLSGKLLLPWEGPFLVVKVMTDVTYRIQKTARSKPQVVHADRLKPYEGSPLKSWKYEAPVPIEMNVVDTSVLNEISDCDKVQVVEPVSAVDKEQKVESSTGTGTDTRG